MVTVNNKQGIDRGIKAIVSIIYLGPSRIHLESTYSPNIGLSYVSSAPSPPKDSDAMTGHAAARYCAPLKAVSAVAK